MYNKEVDHIFQVITTRSLIYYIFMVYIKADSYKYEFEDKTVNAV